MYILVELRTYSVNFFSMIKLRYDIEKNAYNY
jgi:hypothetical protein